MTTEELLNSLENDRKKLHHLSDTLKLIDLSSKELMSVTNNERINKAARTISFCIGLVSVMMRTVNAQNKHSAARSIPTSYRLSSIIEIKQYTENAKNSLIGIIECMDKYDGSQQNLSSRTIITKDNVRVYHTREYKWNYVRLMGNLRSALVLLETDNFEEPKSSMLDKISSWMRR